MFTLDIGGEGRHREAWNLNPSTIKTLGPEKGMPIPRWIPGRAEAIPLPRCSVDRIIVERTPLRRKAIDEILRVMAPDGELILRHVPRLDVDRHQWLQDCLGAAEVATRLCRIGGQEVQETRFTAFQRVSTATIALRSVPSKVAPHTSGIDSRSSAHRARGAADSIDS